MTKHIDESTPENGRSAAEVVADLMTKLDHHDLIDPPDKSPLTDAHLVTVPDRRTVVDLTDKLRQAAEFLKPARRRGTAKMTHLASLIAWADRFKGPSSALFANPDMNAPTLTCIADYHAAGPVNVTDQGGDPTAMHCHHRAIYDFPLSEEWQAWMDVADKPLGKDDLGEFIEQRARDIMDPTPVILAGKENDKNAPWENRLIATAARIEGRFGQLTQLLAMSRQFQVFETSNLQVSTNRDTGESQIQFVNEHKAPDGKPLNIPNLLIIAIPVFVGGAPYRLPVRFRYRKTGGEIRFILSPYNPEKAFEAAFDEAVDAATEQTELTTFRGQPEQ